MCGESPIRLKNSQNEECSQQKYTKKKAHRLQHECPGMSTAMKRKEKDKAEIR